MVGVSEFKCRSVTCNIIDRWRDFARHSAPEVHKRLLHGSKLAFCLTIVISGKYIRSDHCVRALQLARGAEALPIKRQGL